ncbi:MAG: hypothetical protein RSC30_04465, partial [Oscillospiraceae bacterium]
TKSKDSLNSEIAKKLNEYNSIKNKNTKTANNTTKSHEAFEMLSKLADERQTQYHITFFSLTLKALP